LLDHRTEDNSAPLPIYVDLRFYSESIRRGETLDLKVLLKEALKRNGNHPSLLRSILTMFFVLCVKKRALIFDGLDEKLVHLDDAQAQNSFVNFGTHCSTVVSAFPKKTLGRNYNRRVDRRRRR